MIRRSLRAYKRFKRSGVHAALRGKLGSYVARRAKRYLHRAVKRTLRRWTAPERSAVEVHVAPVADAFYGRFLEFGTARMAPKPFLRPAFDAEAGRALDIITDELRKEIEKARVRLARKTARFATRR